MIDQAKLYKLNALPSSIAAEVKETLGAGGTCAVWQTPEGLFYVVDACVTTTRKLKGCLVADFSAAEVLTEDQMLVAHVAHFNCYPADYEGVCDYHMLRQLRAKHTEYAQSVLSVVDGSIVLRQDAPAASDCTSADPQLERPLLHAVNRRLGSVWTMAYLLNANNSIEILTLDRYTPTGYIYEPTLPTFRKREDAERTVNYVDITTSEGVTTHHVVSNPAHVFSYKNPEGRTPVTLQI